MCSDTENELQQDMTNQNAAFAYSFGASFATFLGLRAVDSASAVASLTWLYKALRKFHEYSTAIEAGAQCW